MPKFVAEPQGEPNLEPTTEEGATEIRIGIMAGGGDAAMEPNARMAGGGDAAMAPTAGSTS